MSRPSHSAPVRDRARQGAGRQLIGFAVALAAVGIGGIAFVSLGFTSIAASSRHWPITEWFLHFAMRRAVVMQALDVETPPLDEEPLIALGAGHYESGCAPCHGRPDQERAEIVQSMVPAPPPLAEGLADWRPRELFWIVKNGLKYTGMPAWAAPERDDEVWAVVAFLLRLPSLSRDQYHRLAYGGVQPFQTALPFGDPETTDIAAFAAVECDRCHGRGAAPNLSGLAPAYLEASLLSFAAGARSSGFMEPVAAALERPTMRALALHYGNGSPNASRASQAALAEAGAAEAIERGREIALRGRPSRDVAPCAHCHGPEPVAAHPLFPRLAGQPLHYLETQLNLWVQGQQRGGTEYAHVMEMAVAGLTPAEVRDVSAYYAELEPSR